MTGIWQGIRTEHKRDGGEFEMAQEQEQEQEQVLTLIGDDGEEMQMEVLDFLSLAKGDYVVCAPIDGPEDEAYAFRVVEGDDETYLEDVVDENEWDEVVNAWEQRIEEVEDVE